MPQWPGTQVLSAPAGLPQAGGVAGVAFGPGSPQGLECLRPCGPVSPQAPECPLVAWHRAVRPFVGSQ